MRHVATRSSSITTATETCPKWQDTNSDWDLSNPVSWADIVKFAKGNKIELATGWTPGY